MPNYALSISLTQQQLEIFYATGSNVVVAKPTEGGAPNVAWQVFRPLESNIVNWEEQYGIYASTVAVENGAQLTQMSRTSYPATEGKTYVLMADGSFGPPSGAGSQASYYAANAYPDKPYLTLGLFQDATVNGQQVPGNAISAAPVLLESTAKMTPYTTLYIWLQSEVKSNTVVTEVTSPQTEVRFGGGTTEISLGYDSSSGKFVVKSGFELPEGAAVETFVPTIL
jgi:hypothetical protein